MPTLRDFIQKMPNSYKNQGQCRKCFMNGKSCIYQKDIEKEAFPIESYEKKEKIKKAFMLMPYRNILDEIYLTQFEPCLKYSCKDVKRADDIMMTGFVICEKICKQIQEASFVVAEISFDNPNVFYELGLAYALNKNIALFLQNDLLEGRSDTLRKLKADADGSRNLYEPFSEIVNDSIVLWNTFENASVESSVANKYITLILADKTKSVEKIADRAVEYSMDKICKGSIHKAIKSFSLEPPEKDSIWRDIYTETITIDKNGYSGNTITFSDVEKHIRNARCVIVCTSPSEPCSYFWLGFAHGLEKDVIPITVHDEQSQEKDMHIHSLPFDVRALWHIYVSSTRPRALEKQIHDILEIIAERGKNTYHRKDFWKQILGAGSLSIFVGSVELSEKTKRHVVGEWDYRTVSEVVGFLTSTNETMEPVIQPPIFQSSSLFSSSTDIKDRETKRLTDLLFERNSVIVASADVNDMTELALATYAGIQPFDPSEGCQPGFNGIVAFKSKDRVTFQTPSTYLRIMEDEKNADVRGFLDISKGQPGIHDGHTRFSSTYLPFDKDNSVGYSILFGHIAKFCLKRKDLPGNNWTIVLQGISGPATLGVAQLLTGAKYKQFTVFNFEDEDKKSRENVLGILKTLSPESPSLRKYYAKLANCETIPDMDHHSEDMTKLLSNTFEKYQSVESIIKVFVKNGGEPTHDERKILWWDFALLPREISKPTKQTSIY